MKLSKQLELQVISTTIYSLIGLLLFFLAFAFVVGSMKGKTQKTVKNSPITKNRFITEHEKTMFNELRQSVPECHIFVQVSFGALLKTNTWATRNTFNRKIADYVITDRFFNILAVIELDDKSHDTKQQQDAERDAMLKEAGYKVLRYRYMPDKQKLRSDIIS